jgi:DinB family protein
MLVIERRIVGDSVEFALQLLNRAQSSFADNVKSLTLDEALCSAGGYRSILGVLKHMGGWVHVYWSYAFDDDAKHWARTTWPRGLRDTIDPTADYLAEVVSWIEAGLQRWQERVGGLDDADLDQPHRLHWGETAPLGRIVIGVAHHVVYHTGELNMLLSIVRGEAWEYSEEVEENHISTYGHGVRALWMTDEHARQHEESLRLAHEARLGGK